MKQPYRSYLTPMIHVFKKNGRITKEVLCYGTRGSILIGKADHKYDPIKCGWQFPLGFMYIGPILCCRRCHRHIWSEEQFNKCPQCNRPLKAQISAIHGPIVRGQIPQGGKLMTAYKQQEGSV